LNYFLVYFNIIIYIHHTANGHIDNGIPNHYIQITNMDINNNIHYWTWGENKDRQSHISGNIHGVYGIFIINR